MIFKRLKYLFLVLSALLVISVACILYWASASRDCAHSNEVQDKFLLEFPKEYANDGAYLRKMEEGTEGDIFRSKNFVNIYENSCPYMPSALKLLSDPAYDDGQKVAVVIAMQSLPPADYYELAEASLSLLRQGKLSKRVVDFVFMPWLDLRKIPRNQWVFWHPKWRALLREADKSINDPKFSKKVENKLSGVTFWHWIHM